jgi:acetoacetyl-CoA synthetase
VDGDPMYPDRLGVWRIVSETEATFFSCGASLLMAAKDAGVDPAAELAFPMLSGVCSTGSPLPASGFHWLRDTFGSQVYIQSASGGTDVCTGFVGGSPLSSVRAGRIGGRLLGVDVEALDAGGNPVVGEPGELVVRQAMPSMPVCFWNDADGSTYRDAYFDVYPGLWRHGDWIEFCDDGTCAITGRSDATLNRGGVRLGTSEFYSALAEAPEVADALVVHIEDRVGGLGTLYLFVQLAPGEVLSDALVSKLQRILRSRLSPRHVPDQVLAVREVPYNLSGKKLEVPAKRILQGRSRQSAVADGAVRNPHALDQFEELAAALRDHPQDDRAASVRR